MMGYRHTRASTKQQPSPLLTSKWPSLWLRWQLTEDSGAGASLHLLLNLLCSLVALLGDVSHWGKALASQGVLGGLARGAGVSLIGIIILQDGNKDEHMNFIATDVTLID
jgi:hypothetical protein